MTTRVGEVEAAEWALDQAKAACQVEIAATLAAGVPADKVMTAAGELAAGALLSPDRYGSRISTLNTESNRSVQSELIGGPARRRGQSPCPLFV